MNRRTFFRNLVVGAAAVPAAIKMMADASTPKWIPNPAWENAEYGRSGGAWYRRTLLDWLNDVRSEHHDLRVQCGEDALEYFRANSAAIAGPGQAKFEYEQTPYRWTEKGYIISPYFKDNDGQWRLNPTWKFARTEIAIAYGGTSVHFAPFDRETHLLMPKIGGIPS